MYEQTGLVRSSHLRLQHSDSGPSAVSGQLRFSEICMIWVQCNQQGVKHGPSYCSRRSFFSSFWPPCGPKGCKKRPNPFPGHSLYKSTKPGLITLPQEGCKYCHIRVCISVGLSVHLHISKTKNNGFVLLYCDCNCIFVVLDRRIDDRVDEMLQAGLVEELLQFHRQYNEQQLRDGALVKLSLTFYCFRSVRILIICII